MALEVAKGPTFLQRDNYDSDQTVCMCRLISISGIFPTFLKSGAWGLLNLGGKKSIWTKISGRIAQSVKCLATDASLTADPGVASSIPARSHTFVEIDHEIISTVILLPSAESFKKGFCQLQAKVCAQSTG